MIALYLFTGAIFLFTDLLGSLIHENRKLWGGLLLGYAAFRIFMLYRQSLREKTENHEEK